MSNVSRTTIFLIGVTGYIGGALLTRLLAHPSAKTFDITVFLRSAEKAKLLESNFGVKAVVGTLAELDKLEEQTAAAHVVFSCADCDDVPAIEAILRGHRKRHATTGDLPILIHTSGTGELTDNAKGLHTTDTIYNDLDAAQIETLPPTAFHRPVDLAIVRADAEGYVRTYIILPSTIYGIESNPLVDAGISNPYSIQIPYLIRASLDRRQAGMVGRGVPFWPDVHIDDVADLYIVLYDAIVVSPEKVGHGREGYYFAESGEHTWVDISRAIGAALVKLGITTSAEPTTFTTEELIKYFGSEAAGNYSGSNSRCRANRGRALGWKPVHSTADMIASIKPEIEALIANPSYKAIVTN
ncbi:NAD(P)-binding protein [Sparassis latifolia]|uniref:NAD-P-binding protein n=1 Tax=Sparassis crispa TaxID=139825 RepID=A0A401GXI2_9APHY|nr:NAD-P-binding protein [Sparassis crispa]GBE86890.1 NAD-P-binding protein [Sparassis crispa]